MRKILITIIILALLFCGCGNNSEESERPTATDGPVNTQSVTPTATDVFTPEPSEEATPEVTPEVTLSATATPSATPDMSASKTMYVTGSEVNVREQPTTSSAKKALLVRNTAVTAYEQKDGWYYISYAASQYGYMDARYLGNEPVTTPEPTPTPNETVTHKYNGNTNINDNVFLDALEYTGYNLKKHRDDGNMWVFILGKYKQNMGYLSGLGYDYGVSSGYETNSAGMPDIARMKKNGGLVCASYVTYVYFNYLPHVAGIDTSYLTKPALSCSAQSWRLAAEDWVKKGYSKKISFKAVRHSDGTVSFTENEPIPVGSIVIFKVYGAPDSNDARHVAIYQGYAGGYHWMTHVGNERGPEMVTIEHMGFSSTAEVPLEIITTPFYLE